MTDKTPQIHAALVAVMQDIEAIGKNHNNQQQNFKFRSIDDVYNAVHPIIKKHGIFCAPQVLSDTVDKKELTTKGGSKMLNTGMSVLHKFYAADGSFVEVTTYGEGQDAGDKGAHKAQSMAMKIAYIEMFAIPVEDKPQDRDADYTTPPEIVESDHDLAVRWLMGIAPQFKVRLTTEQASAVFSKIAEAEDIGLTGKDDYKRACTAAKSGRYNLETGEPATGGKCKCGAECPPGETKCPECMEK